MARRRVRNRDGVALAAAGSGLLLLSELTSETGLRLLVREYLVPATGEPLDLAVRALLLFLAFTASFGALLLFLGAWSWAINVVPRGRFLVGLGTGISAFGLLSKFAAATLASGTSATLLFWLVTSLSGLGTLCGVLANLVMHKRVLEAKRALRRMLT